ncbi:hypothetical protein J1N51_06050 [Psychrosphaera ytuae]|uniref:Transglycosylase SLT domain-containing protein n=1 Tax=Psychrosphaera ytuae TaxID=2820710 RepID=A0A975DEN7_9GAMM|nr:hypothetical protein [Psychrosphaera ytuae]QTH65006.1 hypothetical protein J1N51_06050 [Psychrosphaera ytuae]
MKKFLIALIFPFLLASCTTPQPKNISNVCEIFKEREDWWDDANDMNDRWGTPIHVVMAMMYQESSFKADAAPPMEYFLGFIPIGRASSAYGYSQAKTGTWDEYKRESGNSWADRDDFEDAVDFMGWYTNKTYRINKVSKWDAKNQYLNYHEGWGGYKRKTYRKKAWLVKVAKKVDARAKRYAQQLRGCEDYLNSSWLWRLMFY